VALVVDPNDISNNNYRLVGIIRFDKPSSLNWLQQNISPNANWQILIKNPNVWIRDFKNNMRHNFNIENYWEEINIIIRKRVNNIQSSQLWVRLL
jgi:hypothetical protein